MKSCYENTQIGEQAAEQALIQIKEMKYYEKYLISKPGHRKRMAAKMRTVKTILVVNSTVNK